MTRGGAALVQAAVLGYLEPRRDQMQYAAFRAQGRPIGSGIVESANNVVVEARMKGAGRRWAPAHVSPMVALRGAVCSERWTEAWDAIPDLPPDGPKTIVNGRPPDRHPWKRFRAVPPSPAKR